MRLILWLPFYEKNKVQKDLIISGMCQDLKLKANILLTDSQYNEK